MDTGELTHRLLNDVYSEAEEIALAALAAGVPANKISINKPEWIEKDFSTYIRMDVTFIYE